MLQLHYYSICYHGNLRLSKDEEDVENRSQWLQVGNVTIPPIMCDVNKRLANPAFYMEHQRKFLKVHDRM